MRINGNNYNGITTNRIYGDGIDQLGSTIALVNSSDSTVQSYSYDTYGTPYIRTTASGSYTLLKTIKGNTRLFTGREYDSETGLYYYRARYYSSELGRFIQRDPIGVSDNINLYTYVQNNPLRYTDPNGLGSKPLLRINAIGGFFSELIGFDTAYSPGEEDVNSPVVTEDYGEYGDGVILGAGFFGFGKAKLGRETEDVIKEVLSNPSRIQHAYRHFADEFGPWNKQNLEKFKNFVSQIIKESDDMIKTIEKRGNEEIIRYSKNIGEFTYKVDIFTSGEMKGLLRTVTKDLINK